MNYSLLRRYGVAVLSAILTLMLKLVLAHLIAHNSPFMLFLGAVMFSTWYGGIGPGLLVTALATVMSDYFFLGPAYSVLGNKPGETLELGIFVLEGVAVSLLISALQNARQRAEISKLKVQQQQEILRQSEEGFRLLVEGVRDYAIFMLDVDGHFTSWNIGAERILGYKEAEIIGKSFYCIYTPEDLEIKRPEYALKKAIATGQTQDDRWHVRKDGTWFWANGVITPLRDEAGNLRGFSKILRDYTQRKQAEEALHKSEERLRLLVENVKDYAIFLLEPNGQVASWNVGAERILGYTEAEIIGQHFSQFLPPEAVQEGVAEQELKTAAAEGRSEQERWHVRKDGTWFWATEVATSLRDESGNIRGFSKVMRDITERKRAEEERAQLLVREQTARAVSEAALSEAEAANRTKDEFLSIVSHELRTPLTTILLWAELLRAGHLDKATTTQALEIIERNAKAQSQLIEDLLDISRIITGNLRLSVDLVELLPLIQTAVDNMRLASKAKGIEIKIVLTASLVQVLGDAVRLQQVVSNLLSNAIKFTPNGGQVEIRLNHSDSDASIIVSDTGRGISSEFLPYVFDRFRQANSTTTRSQGGIGLGLAIVRHLVELHGGTVYAESPGEGQGARFTVTLPLANISNKSNMREWVDSDIRDSKLFNDLPRLDGLRVLIVDDEADVRQVIALVLRHCGAEVLAVGSSSQALEAIAAVEPSQKPDVLLCDIGMPGEDGYTLLRQVRTLEAERGGKIPAAALTAYVREEDRRQALSAGFQLHVPKPVNPAELVAVVAKLAGRMS